MEDSRSPEVAIREPEQIRSACSCKLRRVKSGPYFKAILACLLGEEWAGRGSWSCVWTRITVYTPVWTAT